ncbi:MAG TPA: aspartate aminotransferase family protein [Roseiflexaceae bacterium]|nr:aspartate aminotransferase family protein [Roseiflexaceae bacterium]
MTNAHQRLYNEAQRYLPGGVTATARVNTAIGRPFYVSRGAGPFVYDLDGVEYIDLCTSHGAALLGHGHPALQAAVMQALELGIICAYETEHHTALARTINEMVPCAEMVRFAGSGTESVMHALRLARAATGREKVIKFEGHFHGYSDALNFSWAPPLAQAGPRDRPTPFPQSAGIPANHQDLVIVVPFNNQTALAAAFAEHGNEVAALLLEPINYDSGCIQAEPGFLEFCRTLCDRFGVVLLFDEVLTAFRMAPGGAQEYTGVVPDLCVLGKAFGAGMPISAIAGRRAIMQHMRPLGESELSGTYLAHLTAVLAARAALEIYRSPGFYERLQQLSEHFYHGFHAAIARSGVQLRLQYVGPRFGLYFGIDTPVTNYREAARQNQQQLRQFVAGCIRRGVYVHVAAHHGFSATHDEALLDRALEAIEGSLDDIRRSVVA